jgi:hypothetical protein
MDQREEKGRHLANTTVKPDVANSKKSAFQRAGISCPGDRPWLGEGAAEANCRHPLVGALINQINLYFPRTLSAISLPDLHIEDETITQLRTEIQQDQGSLGVAKTLWKINRRGTIVLIRDGLEERGVKCDSSQVEAALESLFDADTAALPPGADEPAEPESELLSFRRAEYNILRNEINDPKNVPDLRVIPTTVPNNLAEWIKGVNLVERLCETRAFYGFDRLDGTPNPLEGMPNSAMEQLFRVAPTQPQNRWLPAVKVFGEGIYIELSEDRLSAWQIENSEWLKKRLDDGFIIRLGDIHQVLPPLSGADRNWASRYLLVHTLAHILINQLIFECGYSTASLRERLFISSDSNAPMAAFLIYTAAGDSEGTLGGLVRLGRPELFGSIVHRAISRASWCSADPVCSEHLGGQGAKLANLAACHACTLLPETSCETINHGLDRAMVVGTPYNRKFGFMSSLLSEESYHTLS